MAVWVVVKGKSATYHVLQNHVAVPVKGLDAGQQLAVRADADEDLGVGADGGLQDGQRAVAELPLLKLCDLVFPGGG